MVSPPETSKEPPSSMLATSTTRWLMSNEYLVDWRPIPWSQVELHAHRLGELHESIRQELDVLIAGVGLLPSLHHKGIVHCTPQTVSSRHWNQYTSKTLSPWNQACHKNQKGLPSMWGSAGDHIDIDLPWRPSIHETELLTKIIRHYQVGIRCRSHWNQSTLKTLYPRNQACHNNHKALPSVLGSASILHQLT